MPSAYLGFDLLIDRSPQGGSYRARVLQSPAGEACTDFSLPFTEDELADFLRRTANGPRHLRVVQTSSGAVMDVRAFGGRLYSAAFAGPVGSVLRRSLDEAERRGVGLRIRLRLDAGVPELAELPWEFLFAPDLDRFLALSDQTPIVRYIELDRPAQPLTGRLPLTVLAVIANPSDVTPLAVEREWEHLQQALDPLIRAGVIALEKLEAATLPALQARLRRGPVNLLHFIGHGDFDARSNTGCLVFEQENGRAERVKAETLGMLLHDHEALRLIFLNACEGAQGGRSDPFAGVAQRLVQQGAPAVLAMRFPVSDAAAIALSQAFYQALAAGLPADTALSQARKAIYATGNAWEWGTPVLFSRAEDNRLFDLVEAAQDPLFGLPPLPLSDLPDKPFHYLDWYRREDAEIFYGRGREIRELYDRVTAEDGEPIILLYGQSGVGKSSLLAAGLLPRLEGSHITRYVRRDQGLGLLCTLANALPAAPGEDLPAAWRKLEEHSDKPLLVVLDQVEEVFTRFNLALPDELASFLDTLTQLFADGASRPQGRLILGFRKEWLAEINKRLEERNLTRRRSEVFLERLGRAGIAEVVVGPQSTPRLRGRYGLAVADGLPHLIADDLLADRESPVAPMLAILLTDMWDAARARSYERPVFDADLYHEFRSRGLSLGDFLGRQLQTLGGALPGVVESGLALDLLAYHTTPLGTAEQRTLADLEQTYQHRQDVLPALVQKCRDLYLLVDLSKNQPGQPPASRLTHDTLAPHVRKRFDESDAPGQRARRILESRAVDWEVGKEGPTLDESDLAVVQGGMTGMRMWRSNETGLIAASRQQHDKRQRTRRTWRMAGVLALALLLVAAAIVAFAEQARRSSAEAERISRAGYLATAGLLQYEQDATRGLLLATEAITIRTGPEGIPVPAAEQALRNLMGRLGGYVISGPDAPQVTTMASSPTQTRWVVLGNEAGGLMLWDLTSASLLDEPLKLPGHAARITTSAISSDNMRMVTGDENGSILVWDLAHLDVEPQTLATFDGMVDGLAISPESDWIAASVHSEKTRDLVYLWRADPARIGFDQGTQLKEASGHFITSVMFSPDHRWLFVGGQDGLALLWPLGISGELGAPTSLLQAASGEGDSPDVAAAGFYPFGTELAVGRRDGVIEIWDISQPTPSLAHSLNAGAPVSALGFGGNPVSLVVVGADGRIRSFPPAMDGPADPMVHEPALSGGLAAITFGGDYMATQDTDGQVLLWRPGWTTNGNYDSREISSHRSGLSEEWGIGLVLLSSDGGHLVTTGRDHFTRAWSPLGQRDFASIDFSSDPFVMGVAGGYQAVALSTNGSLLAASDADGGLRIWDIDGVKPTAVFTTFLDPLFITGLAFSADDQQLLAVNYDQLIVYSRKGDAFAPVPSASITVSDTLATGAISSDGVWVVGGSWGGNLYRWQVGAPNAKKIGQIEGSIQKISISADQQWITARSDAGQFGIWRVDDTGAEILAWTCPQFDPSDFITAAQFDPRGSQLILGGGRGEDGFILLCDLAQAQKGTRIDFPQDWVRAIAIDDREKALLSGYTSGFIRRWKLGASEASIPLAHQPEKQTQAGSAIIDLVMASDDEVIIVKAPGITSPMHEFEVWNSRSLRRLRYLGGMAPSLSETPPFTAISKGARWLVTSNASSLGDWGTIQLARLQVADLIEAACRQAGRELTPDEWTAFFLDESYHKICGQ